MSDTFAGFETAAPENVGLDPDRLGRIGTYMDQAVTDGALPGAVTVVLRGGHVAHTHVTGRLDVEREAPLTIDSRFRMYSQTKPVTAAVIMTLFEEGAFALNDPISKWLPEFANPLVSRPLQPTDVVRGGLSLGTVETARRDITIFDLLTMTSGLAAFGRTPATFWPTLSPPWEGTGFSPADTDRFNDPMGTYEELVVGLAETPLFDDPGQTWSYASDFDVLSLFLNRLTGQSLDDLFRERMFEPLGMSSSSFYCPADAVDRLVTDHGWDEEGGLLCRDRPETAEKANRTNRDLMSGNGLFGGMLSTPADYTRFAQMLSNGGELDGRRVLGRKTVELMTANHLGDREIDLIGEPGFGFGFGYAVRKGVGPSYSQGSAGTFGWGGAAGTWFFVDPSEDLVGLFFTHVFGYQFNPEADAIERFQRMVYQSLV